MNKSKIPPRPSILTAEEIKEMLNDPSIDNIDIAEYLNESISALDAWEHHYNYTSHTYNPPDYDTIVKNLNKEINYDL